MKKVTIALEEEVADWTRIHAPENKTGMSRWIGRLLNQKMKKEAGYRLAM